MNSWCQLKFLRYVRLTSHQKIAEGGGGGGPAGSWLVFTSSNTSTPTMGLVHTPGWLPMYGPWGSHTWVPQDIPGI